MTALFVALGIAVITLLALLLWFVPHLLHQQAQRSASGESGSVNMRGMDRTAPGRAIGAQSPTDSAPPLCPDAPLPG